MAYYAELDKDNKVLRVLVMNDKWTATRCLKFLKDKISPNVWVMTKIDGSARGHYAGKNDTYDSSKDLFIRPKPYNSWLLDEQTGRWVAPKPMPQSQSKYYKWHEPGIQWEETLDV